MSQPVKITSRELIKINAQDLVDKFSRKMGHVSSPLVHKSMCRAYAQALNDAQYLLMAAEKDRRTVQGVQVELKE